MEVIAKNKEDYITFSIRVAINKYIDKNGVEKSKEIELRFIDSFKFKNGVEKSKEIELRFIDSFKFMSSSLDSLTANLVSVCLDLRNTLLTNMSYSLKKEFIHTNICPAGTNLKKPNFLLN